MTDRGKITLIYSSVAVISAALLGFFFYLGGQVPEQPVYSNVGIEKPDTLIELKKDLSGVNQAGEQVRLSDLKGKVWLVAEFFAVCPHCAVRNGQELKSIYDEFKDHPDFHMVCISVDPAMDTPERLIDYSEALGADPSDWWFMSHPDEKATHDYLEKEMGFFGIRERKDPVDIETNGRFSHDLGIMLVDREWNIIGKWPLADARSEAGREQDPELYEKLKQQLTDRLTEELEKNETPGI